MQKVSASKFSGKSDLDITKITSVINYRSGDLNEATRLYRKEELLKKKLKTILDTNAALEKQIKTHQTEIKDERASVQFQLNDLIKQMSFKFSHFTEEKLERTQFNSNDNAHKAIQSMMQKYEQIEKECNMMTRMLQSIQKIQSNYQVHAKQMDDLVIDSETSSMEYQQRMEESLNKINQQLKLKTQENEQLDTTTQTYIRQIDQFVSGVQQLQEEQEKILQKIQKMKKMASCQQEKVDEIKEWAEIVIDKNNRKTVFKTIKEKQRYLDLITQKNNQLEIYLKELTNQEEMLLKEKENYAAVSNKESNKSRKCIKLKISPKKSRERL